ncbi:MAG: GntR family transcriptional regulator [Nitrospirales bacterium]|nr:GntR family transcriptional regulator [Nitrospirales bacterium]
MHNKTVDRFDQEKLYLQLTRILREEIHAGGWEKGCRIPTEEELCRTYNVSKITVRQAIHNLVSEGYLIKVQGRGTFVSSVLPAMGLAMKTRLTEEMFGEEVEVEKEILLKEILESAPDARSYLKTDDALYYLLCRRSVHGEPEYLEESFIPSRMLPDLGSLDSARSSLYSLLQEKGLKKIFKVVQTVEVSRVQGEWAKNLRMEEDAPVLVVHRLLLSSDGTRVAYTRFLGRSDRYKFQTEFERIR